LSELEDDLFLDQEREENFSLHNEDVEIVSLRTRSKATGWGFIVLITTIFIGIASFVALDIARLETNTLREWLQTTIAGEIGLLAGLMGSRER
jgi:hypothetical protein